MKKGFLARLATVAVVSATIGMNTVNAASGNYTFEGVDKIGTNKVFYQDVKITDVSGSLITLGSGVTVEDNTCIVFDHIENLDEGVDSNLDRFIFVSMDGFNGNKKIARLYFKSLNNNCKTNIKLDEPTMSFIDNTDIEEFANTNKTIEVQENKIVSKNFKKNIVNSKVFTSVNKLFRFWK